MFALWQKKKEKEICRKERKNKLLKIENLINRVIYIQFICHWVGWVVYKHNLI